jgi:hypothetical protein
MRKSLTPALAYTCAGLTLLVAFLVPFVLINFFSSAVARAGLHVDSIYTGGTVARTIQRDGYQIAVYQVVRPRLLQAAEPFVQLAWTPSGALGEAVNEDVDIDGDGRPDIHVHFVVPSDSKAAMRVDVASLNGRYQALQGVSKNSFSRLIVRTGDSVILRVPLTPAAAGR